MGNNVIPRQQGDALQARFFWLQACKLFQDWTMAVRVEWESTSTVGFDDVKVHYNPAKLDNGDHVIVENYQVKYHVDHQRGFTCEALIDPAFIGVKDDTILKRLYRLYQECPATYKASRYFLVSTWQLDSSDDLRYYIGNGGAFRLDKLFDSTTDASASGKIRKSWREHLGVSTDVLKEVLRPLRIKHSHPDLDGILEQLNDRLHSVGLAPIRADHRATVYHDLIQRLHTEGRHVFTLDELREICRQEGLLVPLPARSADIHVIGVRSFARGAEILELEVKDLLCLLHQFSGRYLLEEAAWDEVFPRLEELAGRALAVRKPLHIHLDTHLSIAFALGYCLDMKSGVQVSIVQKTFKGRILWSPDPDTLSSEAADPWTWREKERQSWGKDIVLALSVTHDIAGQVEDFTEKNLPNVSRMIFGTVKSGPSSTAIRGANHIIRAVQDVVRQLPPTISKLGTGSRVHLFVAGPNAFAFFLGQQSHSLGRMVLYEFDFERMRTGDYEPAISLPVKTVIQ